MIEPEPEDHRVVIPDGALTFATLPVRYGAQRLQFYFVHCPHGTTRHHDPLDLDEGAMKIRIIDDHYRETGCRCRPSS